MNNHGLISKIILIAIFAIAMAFAESAVVVYLRSLYHPEGFIFPLKLVSDHIIITEPFREIATIVMLSAVAFIAGKKRWERFAYFILSFGIWDIFYYVWLNVLIGWPSSVFEWDVLFLIPLTWIGPVIAPASVSGLMIVFGILMARSMHKGDDFRPSILSYILALIGTGLILYSFMYDLGATMHQQMPKPYRYDLLIIGDVLYIAAFVISYCKCKGKARLAPTAG